MNDLDRLLAPVMGYIDLGMFGDAWEELWRTGPPETRADFAVLGPATATFTIHRFYLPPRRVGI